MFIFKKKMTIQYIEIAIVDHCNLSCCACSHFSNIASPRFTDIAQYKDDIIQLKTKFKINQIRILGGEPLLHPKISDILKITRKYFQYAEIDLVTNGLLLLSLNDLFWDTVKNNHIIIDVSQYPINKTLYEKIIIKLKNNNLKYYVPERKVFSLFFNKNGHYDKKITFECCPIKQNIILVDGNIYHCPIGHYIKYYNKFFNTNLTMEEGITLKNNTSEQITQYLKEPTDSCKYCTFADQQNGVKYINWQRSNKEPDEWYR